MNPKFIQECALGFVELKVDGDTIFFSRLLEQISRILKTIQLRSTRIACPPNLLTDITELTC